MIKIINFYHTHHSSSSPLYLSFVSVLSSFAISFYLTLFIISFTYPFPPLTFYYNYPIIHFFFFLPSSFHPISPFAHYHSSPPSSNFHTPVFLSYYHAPSPLTNFFLFSSSWNIYRLFLLHPSPSTLISLSSFPSSVMTPATYLSGAYRCSRLSIICNIKSITAWSCCHMQALY